ncbi:MAG: ATP-binding protein [Alphaproteobacteria bacterium]|nr:ATP-binding protein [Alphaproteobacteria bacterium]
MMTLRMENFRVLRKVDWDPEGVSLLTGPNGSGKTTMLDALEFLRGLFLYGHESGFSAVGGSYFRRLGTPPEEPVSFEVEVGAVRWVLRFPMSMTGLRGQYGEELYHGEQRVLRAGVFEEGWTLHLDGEEQRLQVDERRCCAKVLWDMGRAPWMKPLVSALGDMQIHHVYDLEQVRQHQAAAGISTLHGTGRNLWSVLSTWSQARIRYGGRYQWVMAEARRAFPDIFGTLEFDRGLPYLFGPNASDPADGLPPSRAADGLLTGLLHLTAIAGVQDGAVLAFDEVENQLHPHAIHSILRAMRAQAEARDLTIILTTHAPVVLNMFKGQEDRIFVLQQPSEGPLPRPLDELHDPDWLAYFVLGDLYERLEFGAPRSQEG